MTTTLLHHHTTACQHTYNLWYLAPILGIGLMMAGYALFLSWRARRNKVGE